MRAIDARHLGNEKVICCWELDGVLVDPGPQSTEADAARGARRRSSRARSCSRTSTSTTPASPARSCAAGPTCPSTCTSAARRTWPRRSGSSPARRGSTAARRGSRGCGARSCRCPSATCTCSSGGETVLGRLPRRVHARARLAPRQLPARAERHRVRRRRGRRADPAARLRDGADAAARRRRRGLGPLARPRRGLGAAGARADPLRPRRRRRPAPRRRCASACTRSSGWPPGTGPRRSPPGSSSGSSAARGDVADALRAGVAARPPLPRRCAATSTSAPPRIAGRGATLRAHVADGRAAPPGGARLSAWAVTGG